jgi:glycosyltransferase involved in cell wall biosynthesis
MMTDRPLRFCMITTFYPPYNFGGDGIFVQQLSHELARRGHQVEVIHCMDAYRQLAHREPTGTYGDHANVVVHGLESPFGFFSPLATQQTGFPLFKAARIRQILGKGFDVIHYHNLSLVGGPKILEYGQGIKLYTMHEYWLICPTHVLFRFNRSLCLRRYCFACQLTYRRPPQWWRYSALLKRAVKHVDAFISPSQSCEDLHRRMGFTAPIVCLPHFIPPVQVTQSTPAPPTDEVKAEPYFLFVGRLERVKGLQTLIPVLGRYPNALLLIAGTGSDEPRLRELAQGLSNIRFLGYQSSEQLRALYRQTVAVIVPSICFEVFPLVVLEAFREGTPVIARNLGGLPEMIREGGGGFTYDTEEELIRAMDHLLANPSARDELGRRGYQAYQRRWTVEAHLERYLALIAQVARTRGLSAARSR